MLVLHLGQSLLIVDSYRRTNKYLRKYENKFDRWAEQAGSAANSKSEFPSPGYDITAESAEPLVRLELCPDPNLHKHTSYR